ncbi:hypothetical protein H8356DRAFT_1354352 [Neocallimastix lanati (nom. inval.)]|nr:hypothetical protein H8356DRAFT_1354352 [Neocallimastix sp. JGI-2020a]
MEENLIIDINKCKSFIILNDKKEILKYDSSHNHPEKEYDISLPMMKHKIKDGIEKSSIHFGENFMTFKNSNLIIFQSPFQVKLFKEYNDDIFVDDTFFIAPTYSYQIFITRTYAKELDSFYTTSFAILKNKEQEKYKILFEKLKKKKVNTCNNNIIIKPRKNLHCDFERDNIS